MIADSGIPSGGSVSRGLKQDNRTRHALAKRQQKRKNIEDADMIFKAIAESFPAVFSSAKT